MRQLLTTVYLVAVGALMQGQNTPNAATGNFAGEYRSVKPEQKALVDDWMKRFSETIRNRSIRRWLTTTCRSRQGRPSTQ
jgi:hypothetical protein